jgi:hypothetical protein
MGIIKQIALSILLLSFAVFVAFFGRLPIFRYPPSSLLNPIPTSYRLYPISDEMLMLVSPDGRQLAFCTV